jgi:hypothetical protein
MIRPDASVPGEPRDLFLDPKLVHLDPGSFHRIVVRPARDFHDLPVEYRMTFAQSFEPVIDRHWMRSSLQLPLPSFSRGSTWISLRYTRFRRRKIPNSGAVLFVTDALNNFENELGFSNQALIKLMVIYFQALRPGEPPCPTSPKV